VMWKTVRKALDMLVADTLANSTVNLYSHAGCKTINVYAACGHIGKLNSHSTVNSTVKVEVPARACLCGLRAHRRNSTVTLALYEGGLDYGYLIEYERYTDRKRIYPPHKERNDC
jgi:hypothetical protein